MLKVIERFETHEEAKAWYLLHEGTTPSNCMVEANDPEEFEHTLGYLHLKTNKFVQDPKWLRPWDEHCQECARKWPVFLVCEYVKHALSDPIIINDGLAATHFPSGHLPNTRFDGHEIGEAAFRWFEALFDVGPRWKREAQA